MLDVQERTTTPAPPSKRWRNYYFAYRFVRPVPGHPQWLKGRINVGPTVFPSKEIAEQRARDFIAGCTAEARSWFDYLGAFPEGEEPG